MAPYYNPNQNTGNPVATDTVWKVARQTIYHDKGRPHRLRYRSSRRPPSRDEPEDAIMTWIRTVPLSDANEALRHAIEQQQDLYPVEYAEPVHPTGDGTSGIVASHSLIPDALGHAFSTFGALMSPTLPLNRTQHEMITTMVSVTNRCRY